MSSLLIRCDASADIGFGHAMRCLALAQAWKDRVGDVEFIMAGIEPALAKRMGDEGIGLGHIEAAPGSPRDAEETAVRCRKSKAWAVVDGYHFGADYQKVLKDAGVRVLFIDDWVHAESYIADIVLNQNIYAQEHLYSNRVPHVCILAGPDYVLLRREFVRWHGWRRDIPDRAQTILITLGGGDDGGAIFAILEALRMLKVAQPRVQIIIGPANPQFEKVQKELAGYSLPFRIVQDASDMPGLMAEADLAVSAGGSTCWELAFMGVPALTLVLAENQRPIAEGLDSRGIARNMGWAQEVKPESLASSLGELIGSAEKRRSMSKAGRQLIDGRGAQRVIAEMER